MINDRSYSERHLFCDTLSLKQHRCLGPGKKRSRDAFSPIQFCLPAAHDNHPKRSKTQNNIDFREANPIEAKHRVVKQRQNKQGIVKLKEMDAFFRLLDDPLIHEFLCADSCLKISDKYLLAMVFTYFKRACFNIREFNRMNFFAALFLANDMEEDEEDYKFEICPWILGDDWQQKLGAFYSKRDRLWSLMGYRAVVSRKCCEEVMKIVPDCWVWKRVRPLHHTGAIRPYHMDPSCQDCRPRGPNMTPKFCEACAAQEQYDSASPDNSSWCISSCSESSLEKCNQTLSMNHKISTPASFNLKSLKHCLPLDGTTTSNAKSKLIDMPAESQWSYGQKGKKQCIGNMGSNNFTSHDCISSWIDDLS